MKIKKSFLSVCLSILFMFGCFVPSINVYASSGEGTSQNWLAENWNKAKSKTAGFISDAVDYTADFLRWLTDHKSSYGIGENENPNDWVNDNTFVDPHTGNITISDNVINSMRDVINNYIVNGNYKYVYTLGLSDISSHFNDELKFNAVSSFVSQHEDSSIVLYSCMYNRFVLLPLDTYDGIVFQRLNLDYPLYDTYLYKNSERLVGTFPCYTYNDNSHTFSLDGDFIINAYLPYFDDVTINNLNSLNYAEIHSTKVQKIMYNSLNDYTNSSQGVKDYYVSDSYNSEHITGSYNTTITDINNSPTYSDVNSYINSYYLTNQSYPTTNQIYTYINNYTGSGEGGSGEGGSGEGGSGDEEEGEGIWDLIQKVLDFIAQLFDTIAGFLADLVDSLGDIVNAVVNNILNLITSIKDNIPNAIGSLLEWFFPYLPDEIISLIELTIMCMVIVGIIRLIRGH